MEDTSRGTLMQSFSWGLLQAAKEAAAPGKTQALRAAQLQVLGTKGPARPYNRGRSW